jgi:predicted Zn-dependent protease
MSFMLSRLTRMLMLALALTMGLAPPAVAQDDDDEGRRTTVLRDSETEQLFRDLSRPLVTAAGLNPASVDVVLVNDQEVNAFVSSGQRVYLHSGLLLKADNVNEVQGVIAHELGHVAGGHSIRLQQGIGRASGLSIATLVLGALAMAAGAGEAGTAIMMAGQRAALGNLLAFTRTQESSADQAGAKYLSAAGVSGKGLLDFFGKLQNQEYRLAVYAKESYDRTHPLSTERVAALTNVFKSDPAWERPPDPALEARFQRVKAKLLGFVSPKQATAKYPESDRSVPAHYARAYAYHVGGYPQKALAEADALLAKDPADPFFLELKGQVLLESGRPADAIAPLRTATDLSGNSPLIASMLSHALIATDRPQFLPEAKQVLKAAVGRDNENSFAWYQLGIIYDREGDRARAALATAERNNIEGKPKLALRYAEAAMKGISANSPDYLRAQDIAMVSRAEIKKDKKNR